MGFFVLNLVPTYWINQDILSKAKFLLLPVLFSLILPKSQNDIDIGLPCVPREMDNTPY